jgi:outer membrane protein OmpA-like peptidoglycan-associated protein
MKRALTFVSIMITFLTGNSQTTKSGLFDQSSVKASEVMTNTARSDFGTAVIGDTIYFSSFRDDLLKKSDKELKDKNFYDLFKAGMDKFGNVISNRKSVVEFYTGFHNGPVSWCAKTEELFVTQSNCSNPSIKYEPFINEEIKLKMVVAKKNNNKWYVVEEFPFNNAEYSVGHPAISPSGDTLLFASDMPGGFGATDLYMSVRTGGKWGLPVNLGAEVNTSGKDEFPFITGNSYGERYLVFASTGHGSTGGFDLFYKKLNDPKGEVIRFPEPINSTNDDFAMSLPENVEYGFMTSNREGTGNDDIYKLTFSKFLEYLQEILIFDANTRRPITGAKVNFCDKKTAETGSDGKVSMVFPKNSTCNVMASAFGYKDNSKLISVGSPKQGTVLRDTIFLNMIVNEKIVLKNIYYDFDKWDIIPESAKELDQLVSLTKDNPEMKVELSSHTDSRGSLQYNQKLSQLRAQSAVDYIISKGIDKLRVKGTGYGETQLINKCKDGVECTPAEHRENRRTELFIPGFLTGEPVAQTLGDYSDGKPDHDKGYISYKEHGSIFERPTSVGAANVNVVASGGAAGSNLAVNGSANIEYNLILGSFKDTINAEKYIQKLKADGYEATILSDKEPVRVGNKFRYYSQAKKALDDLKSKSYIGWIIRVN